MKYQITTEDINYFNSKSGRQEKLRPLNERENKLVSLFLSDENDLKKSTYQGFSHYENDKGNKYKSIYEAGMNNPVWQVMKDYPCWIIEGQRGKRIIGGDNKIHCFDNAQYREKRDLSCYEANWNNKDFLYLASEYAGTGNGYYYIIDTLKRKKLLIDID